MTHDEHRVDKSDMGDGPWQIEPDYLQWTTEAGLPGLIVRNQVGCLCGYAGVPNGHPLYEVSCQDIDVQVHGGLTYSAHCNGAICHAPGPGETDDVWWFGFDCSHAPWDYVPRWAALTRQLGMEDTLSTLFQGSYKGIDYVRNEVEGLARKLEGYNAWDSCRSRH